MQFQVEKIDNGWTVATKKFKAVPNTKRYCKDAKTLFGYIESCKKTEDKVSKSVGTTRVSADKTIEFDIQERMSGTKNNRKKNRKT